MKLRFCLLFSFLYMFVSCSSQRELKSNIKITKTVSGIVKDEYGSLPGANIVVKNERRGAVTDMDGKFEISINEKDTLIVSFIGLEPKEVTITSENYYEVNLEAYKPFVSRKEKRRIKRELRKNGFYIYPD